LARILPSMIEWSMTNLPRKGETYPEYQERMRRERRAYRAANLEHVRKCERERKRRAKAQSSASPATSNGS